MSRYLIWDFDGTLAYRPGGWSGVLALLATRKTPGLDITPDSIRPYLQSGFPWHAPECAHIGQSADEWWEELLPLFARALRGVGVEAEQARALAREVRSVYADPSGWVRYEDALPTLQALSECGWQHILLTNHIPELPDLLYALGFTSQFAAIFNSAQTGWEKPNAHAFRTALEWIDAHSEVGYQPEIWMIGDSLKSDVRGAQEVGLRAILARSRHESIPCCEQLGELVNLLNANNR